MTIRVAILMFHQVEVLDFAGPYEVFGVSGRRNPRPDFDVYTVSAGLSTVEARNGLTIGIDYPINPPAPEVFVVPGGFGTRRERHNPALLQLITELAETAQCTMTVCSGALLAGEAGLLKDKHATTHLGAMEDLRNLSAFITVHEKARIVDNGDIICSTGISAGIDASLYTAARFTSTEAAQATADYMQYNWRYQEVDDRSVVRVV